MMDNRRNALWLLMIVLLLAGLFTGRTVFFQLAYVFFGVMIVAFLYAWLAVRGIHIGRRTRSGRSQVGQTFSEEFLVRNSFFLPKLWLEVRDHSNLPNHRASHVVPTLLPGRDFRWQVETQSIVRGEFSLGPLTIRSGDPFGLFLTPRHIAATQKIIIYPRTVPIARVPLPPNTLSGGEPQSFQSQNITTNAAGVREYVPGDSINRIHWKSTARRGKLIVKEFELDPLTDLWIIVDFSTESLHEDPQIQRLNGNGPVIQQGDGIPPSTEEYSVVIAASLASHFIAGNRAVGFSTYAPHREYYPPERGQRQLLKIMETLAVARSTSQRTLREMLATETPNIKRGANLLLITANQSKDWTTSLQMLHRRGVRTTAIIIEAASFGGLGSDEELRGTLELMRIPYISIRRGDNISDVLAHRIVI